MTAATTSSAIPAVAALLLATAGTLFAQDSAGGWTKQGTSLLFRGSDGSLSEEIGLVRVEESVPATVTVKETRGGVSPNARFAWTLETSQVFNAERTKLKKASGTLRVYGSGGQPLWDAPSEAAPEGVDPVLFSDDGETLLVARREAKGWIAEARSYVGAVQIAVGPMAKLQMLVLVPNGRYALVRWSVPDESATHTFFDIPAKRRVDIPSGELYLGLAKITPEGQVFSGKKLVYDFAKAAEPVAVSTPTASGAPKP